MSRRVQRVASLIRETLAQAVFSKLADPRIDPGRISITRVEVPEDLLTAKVFLSVIGTDAEQRNALRAMRHAAGHLQEMIGRKVRLRNTPRLSFEIDLRFKKTQETLDLIQQAMGEIHQKEQDAGANDQVPDNPMTNDQAPSTNDQQSRIKNQ